MKYFWNYIRYKYWLGKARSRACSQSAGWWENTERFVDVKTRVVGTSFMFFLHCFSDTICFLLHVSTKHTSGLNTNQDEKNQIISNLQYKVHTEKNFKMPIVTCWYLKDQICFKSNLDSPTSVGLFFADIVLANLLLCLRVGSEGVGIRG